jgi:hypothetical protein
MLPTCAGAESAFRKVALSAWPRLGACGVLSEGHGRERIAPERGACLPHTPVEVKQFRVAPEGIYRSSAANTHQAR